MAREDILLHHTLANECKRLVNFHSTQRKKESANMVEFYRAKAVEYEQEANLIEEWLKIVVDISTNP